jgi:hypothetical protein
MTSVDSRILDTIDRNDCSLNEDHLIAARKFGTSLAVLL